MFSSETGRQQKAIFSLASVYIYTPSCNCCTTVCVYNYTTKAPSFISYTIAITVIIFGSRVEFVISLTVLERHPALLPQLLLEVTVNRYSVLQTSPPRVHGLVHVVLFPQFGDDVGQ